MLIQLLILQIVTFVGIIFLLRFLFSRHLNSALTRLNALHEENLAKEEELNEELRRAKEESQAQIQQGKLEAEQIMEEAIKEANRMRLNMEEQAKKQVEKIIIDGHADAEKLKVALVKETRSKSVELASRIIAELLTETDKITLQYELANEIITEIARLDQSQFSMPSPKATVTSSFPLLERQMTELKKMLSEKIGQPVELTEKTDLSLIGGLTVETGGMLIDGSLKNKLQKIAGRF